MHAIMTRTPYTRQPQQTSTEAIHPAMVCMVGQRQAIDRDKVTKRGEQKTFRPSLTLSGHYSKTVFPNPRTPRHRTPLAAPVEQHRHPASFPTYPTHLVTPPWSPCPSTPALMLLFLPQSSRPRSASLGGCLPSTRLRCLFRRRACRRSPLP